MKYSSKNAYFSILNNLLCFYFTYYNQYIVILCVVEKTICNTILNINLGVE